MCREWGSLAPARWQIVSGDHSEKVVVSGKVMLTMCIKPMIQTWWQVLDSKRKEQDKETKDEKRSFCFPPQTQHIYSFQKALLRRLTLSSPWNERWPSHWNFHQSGSCQNLKVKPLSEITAISSTHPQLALQETNKSDLHTGQEGNVSQ